ncbi:MAG: hypothetical protein GXP29_07145 [Planctomycetes bacterium]|nr:hypothetical protein [Planctomycetota bacterium]
MIAEAMVRRQRNGGEHGQAILSLLTDESLPVLRELVVDSPNDAFHWGALSALAHLGDSTIVPEIKTRQEQFKQVGDRRAVGTLGWYWLQINVQKSPKSLLTYIAARHQLRVEECLWAIQRAYDRGIPKADIRQAVFDHAETVDTNEHGIRPGLTSIKNLCIPLGVLYETDLPGVRYYEDISSIVSW